MQLPNYQITQLPTSRLERLFVWLGGAAFVGSLAVCAWMYAIRWGRFGDLPTSWRAAAINAAIFIAFGAHHSLFARDATKRRIARIIPDRLVRSTYVWVASLLLVAWLVWWQPVGGVLYSVGGSFGVLHAAVQIAGLVLIAWSVRAIDALDLAGIRTAPAPERLQIRGPYRLVRHPLYLGWVLVVFGAANMTGDRFAFAAITTAYLVLAMPWEERSLTRAFGEEYVKYRQRVRHRLLPFVY